MRWLANPWGLAISLLAVVLAFQWRPPVVHVYTVGDLDSSANPKPGNLPLEVQRLQGKTIVVQGQVQSADSSDAPPGISGKTHFVLYEAKRSTWDRSSAIYCALPPEQHQMTEYAQVRGVLRIARRPSGEQVCILESVEPLFVDGTAPSAVSWTALVVLAAIGHAGYAFLYWMRRLPNPAAVDDCKCSQCGYDLGASPDRCPECGAAVGERFRHLEKQTALNSLPASPSSR